MSLLLTAVLVLLLSSTAVGGQEPVPEDHTNHTMPPAGSPSPWMFMYDGALFGTFSHQGGPRGGREFISTDWLESRTASSRSLIDSIRTTS